MLAMSAVVVALAGCGSSHQLNVAGPFVFASVGSAGGPESSAWGDEGSGPAGSTIGCIDGRRLVVAVGVSNRTKHTVTLTGSPPAQLNGSIASVAVRFELLPKPTRASAESPSLPSLIWSRRGSGPLSVPASRGVWVESSLLMNHCSLIATAGSQTVNGSIKLDYRESGRARTQVIVARAARIILVRGPTHPTVPINQTG